MVSGDEIVQRSVDSFKQVLCQELKNIYNYMKYI
jgi:hypothetical protein